MAAFFRNCFHDRRDLVYRLFHQQLVTAYSMVVWCRGYWSAREESVLTYGIIVDKIHRFERLRLPWDEQIAFPSTDLAGWTVILWLFSLLVYLFVLYGSRRLWSSGRRRAAMVLAANVLFFLIAGVVDLAIDLRKLRWVYVAEFRFLLCIVSMAVYSTRHFSRKS